MIESHCPEILPNLSYLHLLYSYDCCRINTRILPREFIQPASEASRYNIPNFEIAMMLDSTEQTNEHTRKIRTVFRKQKMHALSLRSSTYEERLAKLKKLKQAVLDNQVEMCEAAYADFKKTPAEVEFAEIFAVLSQLNNAISHLGKWMKPKGVPVVLALLGTKAHIRYEPKGTTLIISPWNYPFTLSFGPLISALAAGNTVMLKPSETTPNMSSVIRRILESIFDEEDVAVFEGAIETSTALLELPFDHIFFTGSPMVGRIVMAAAAKNLTSVTLELGGKSPTIVDRTANIKKTARNLAWSKFLNNGQTCISPDHVYVHADIIDEFCAAVEERVQHSYGKTIRDQSSNPDYCRIVNQKHFERLSGLIDDAVQEGAKVVFGGETGADRFIAPTLLRNVNKESAIMQQEIFGPVMPVFAYTDIDKVIAEINARPKPLALYVFSGDKQFIEKIISRTSAGGTCINTSIVHFLQENLPFGGVNDSGIGKAHGEYGFKAFSNERAVVQDKFSMGHLMFPPYTPRVRKFIQLATRYLT